ncbi:MAG TPA: hypothetical protein VI612_05345 [Candidatus Nanoarchaeia archaeon]|nr:hypothetical protein [Candidatus Nanoarchaeia archaeon]
MGLFTIILIIGIIALAVMALHFLVGLVRTVVSLALFVIAAGLLISLMTGTDLIGIGPTMGSVVSTVNETVQNISIPQITP